VHDYTGVRRKCQNHDGTAVFVDFVDEDGNSAGTETLDPIVWYPSRKFALSPVYVCECGMEYHFWSDMVEHLSIFGPDE
jgi:hypothetical protein